MTDLTPITALGGPAARVASFGSVSLTENTGLALASLAGAADVAPMGLDLPPVGGAVSAGGYGAFWTGPSQWMIEAAGRAETDFAAALQAQAPDCVVTEQTDGFVCFEITAPGAGLTGLLQKLVNLDPKTLGPGRAVRTGLEHMTVFLIRRSDTQLAVIGMRSLAETLWHALSVAARRLED
ncbi:sarcosine oxidase subunit gamma [Thalassobius sp. S69A]|uniref:sarcosine oxidase subunit gamma n=1 Tax=unclassified Thalassovita TaxID=2619711 RepID=UPI000C120227|nr:sarcosine oxidase subunit gamma [Paracoccaceae bacterium]MBT26188.1 sarcosine oxidase subunit gamma [Paracoccaceae bacterium]